MFLAKKKIMPPREWMHDYNLKDSDNRSLKYHLKNNNLLVPYHWYDNDMTIFD